MTAHGIVSMDDFARAAVASGFEQGGEPVCRPGGSSEGQRESASVGTVAASLGGN
jgi:hypothetical protein